MENSNNSVQINTKSIVHPVTFKLPYLADKIRPYLEY